MLVFNHEQTMNNTKNVTTSTYSQKRKREMNEVLESDAWKKFLDILIPPKNYWEIKYSFDFTGDTTTDGSGVTIPIINNPNPALAGVFNA